MVERENTSITVKTKQGTAIDNWGKEVAKHSNRFPFLVEKLTEDRLVGIRGLEELDLPRYRSETLPLSTFLEDPDQYFDKVGSKRYYIIPLQFVNFTRTNIVAIFS